MMQTGAEKTVSERICWSGILSHSMSMDKGRELINTLKKCETLTVNLDGVKIFDASYLVILCSAKRKADETGKFLRVEGLDSPAVAPMLQRFRGSGNNLCRTYCGHNCLFD